MKSCDIEFYFNKASGLKGDNIKSPTKHSHSGRTVSTLNSAIMEADDSDSNSDSTTHKPL